MSGEPPARKQRSVADRTTLARLLSEGSPDESRVEGWIAETARETGVQPTPPEDLKLP